MRVRGLGFNDGFGLRGWSPASARHFAAWGARIDGVIPPDHRVKAVFGLDSLAFDLEVRGASGLVRVPTSVERLTDEGYEVLLRMLVTHFGRTTAPPLRARPIYTIQLAATRDRHAADRLAARLHGRRIAARGSFYYASCGPCPGNDPQVLAANHRGHMVYRIVTGVFNSRRAAVRALSRLERTTHRAGFVRRL